MDYKDYGFTRQYVTLQKKGKKTVKLLKFFLEFVSLHKKFLELFHVQWKMHAVVQSVGSRMMLTRTVTAKFYQIHSRIRYTFVL